MTTNEAGMLFGSIASAYPNSVFANMPPEKARGVIKTWSVMLNMSLDEAMVALSYHVRTNKFPPTIADLHEGLYTATHPMVLAESEAWSLVLKASQKAIYYSEEEYDKLPMECKRAIGSPEALKELAMSTNNDVASSNFKRAYRKIIDEHKASEMADLLTLSQDELGIEAETKPLFEVMKDKPELEVKPVFEIEQNEAHEEEIFAPSWDELEKIVQDAHGV